MPENYQVKQGDCISSIAFEKGFFPQTLWDHPKNKELSSKRKDRNVLLPGDTVFVPDMTVKELSEPTNQVHKYRLKNTPEKLKLQLLKESKPRANEAFELDIDGVQYRGSTDSQGKFEQSIPPNAKHGTLVLTSCGETYDLRLGNLDPHDEIAGVQGRLRHLGFYFGAIDGEISDDLEHAVQEFQITKDLEPDGELSDSTLNAIKQAYGE